jgi:uncharacterized protein DUF4304
VLSRCRTRQRTWSRSAADRVLTALHVRVRSTSSLWLRVCCQATSTRRPAAKPARAGGTDADSHVRQRVGALIGDGEDHWWPVELATDTEQLIDKLRRILEERALPWLEARGNLDRLVALARNDPEHFPRYALGRFGMLLARAGHEGLAREMTTLGAEAPGP